MRKGARYGLHWFRRDLRVAGNPALEAQWKRYHGRVLGIFCFDTAFLSRPDMSINRSQLFLATLSALQRELRAVGSDLLILDTGPDAAFRELRDALQNEDIPLPERVSWNRDYEPFARTRGQRIETMLHAWQVETLTARDHLLFEPHEIAKPDGRPHTVFTPFFKRWLSALQSTEGQARNGKGVTVPVPDAGSNNAVKFLYRFADKLDEYASQRDFPAADSTSHLSIYFKNGAGRLYPPMRAGARHPVRHGTSRTCQRTSGLPGTDRRSCRRTGDHACAFQTGTVTGY